MSRATQQNPTTPALYVALELSKDNWKLALTTGRARRPRIRDVPARNQAAFLAEVEGAKRHFGLSADAPVFSCYEAGRDGFWIHRFLAAHGIENIVVDPASIEVSRRKRKVKTDRVDAVKLAKLLARHHEGEDVVSVVHVPPLEIEEERLLPRQLKSLKDQRTRITNQIRAELFLHGVELNPREGSFAKRDFLTALEKARQWDGTPLPEGVIFMVRLHWEQYALIESQIKDLSQRQREALRRAREGSESVTHAQEVAARLTELKGVGDVGAYVLSLEFFCWREFKNRKQIGALAGLTGTPYQSGAMDKDQGISKAGNKRVRTLAIELAWLWLRYQPDSELTRWFHSYVGQSKSRVKRKAITALARKLLIAFWHYLEHGVVPQGACLKSWASPEAAA